MDVLAFATTVFRRPSPRSARPSTRRRSSIRSAAGCTPSPTWSDSSGSPSAADPEEASRPGSERYPDEVTPAWHTNKRLWNDVRTTGDLPDAFIRAQIRNSYLLVVRRNVTPRARREEILARIGELGLPE